MIAASAVFALLLTSAIRADSAKVPPPRVPQDRWVAHDKFQHATMSYAITAFSFSVTQNEPASIATAALAGILKEVYDKKSGKIFSAKDLVWDAIGIAAGYAIIKQAR